MSAPDSPLVAPFVDETGGVWCGVGPTRNNAVYRTGVAAALNERNEG